MNVARIILGYKHDPDVYPGSPNGLDPNHEHPPLAKLMIALSMGVLGDNAYGFRIPSVIFGTASIFIFYLLMKKVSKNSGLSLIATFLFMFDNLVFVHGRIATLDIFVLTFMLLGFYWYFSGRTVLSAVALALSTLSKIGGFYGFAIIVAYHFLKDVLNKAQPMDWRSKFEWLEKFLLTYLVVGMVLLAFLDYFWTSYKNPFDHLAFIFNYTKGLTREVPQGIESYPWQWLLNEVRIPYLTVNVNTYSNGELTGTFTSVAFVGAMNPLIIYLTIPTIVYSAYRYYQTKEPLTLFIVVWFALSYLPFFPMSFLWHRIMYLFYFLNTVPGVCAGIAYLLIDQRPPKFVVLVYLIGVLVGFYQLFPFKTVP